jgi:hypothetical protein
MFLVVGQDTDQQHLCEIMHRKNSLLVMLGVMPFLDLPGTLCVRIDHRVDLMEPLFYHAFHAS